MLSTNQTYNISFNEELKREFSENKITKLNIKLTTKTKVNLF